MKQRIKLAFKILFCKRYFFCDGNFWSLENLTINHSLGMIDVLKNLTEETLNQEALIQEAKQLIKQDL